MTSNEFAAYIQKHWAGRLIPEDLLRSLLNDADFPARKAREILEKYKTKTS